MNYIVKSLILFFFLSAFISCSTSFSTDDFVPASDIDFFTGSTAQFFEDYSDSLRAHPFTIKDLSRGNNLLNIDVTYAGGEGECPPHLFVVHWDESIHRDQSDSPLVQLGLGHFLPTVDNCEALVDERLEIDLAELLGEQLQDDLSFNVTNLVDSIKVTLNP